MDPSKVHRHGPWIVFAVALIFRMAYLAESTSSPLFDVYLVDAEYYDRKARELLVAGILGGPAVFTMSPLYPYFLAAVYALTGGEAIWIKAIQHVMGAVSCAMLARIGMTLFGPWAGFFTGMLASVYGLLIFTEGTLENEFLVIFLNLCAVMLLVSGRLPLWRVATAGLALGLSIGVRPNAALLILPAAVWLWSRREERKTFSVPAAFFATALLPVFLIGLRNHHVSGEWVWTTSTGGELLYIGTLDGGGGYVTPDFIYPHPDREHEDFRRNASEQLGRPVSAGESSRYWAEESLKAVRDRPIEYARLLGKKALAFFNSDELPDNYDFYFSKSHSRVLACAPGQISVLIPLFLLGMVVSWPGRRLWVLPMGLFFVYLASVLVFYQSYRFRLPALPAMMLFAGAALAWMGGQIRTPSVKACLGAVVLLGLSWGLAHVPLKLTDRAQTSATVVDNYFDVLVRNGRTQAAVDLLEDAHRRQPENPQIIRRLADVYLSRLNRIADAAALYEKIRDVPKYAPDARRNLTVCYFSLAESEYGLGNIESSKSFLRRVLELDPAHPQALEVLRRMGG